MVSTKEEEKKALEKIRKIIEGLGEGSYLSYAFDGSYEVALYNIENDFADSWKARYEVAENRAAACAAQVADLEEKNEALCTQQGQLEEDIENLRANLLPKETVDFLLRAVSNEIATAEKKKRKYEADIIKLAEVPNSAEFKGAVISQRQEEEWIRKCNEIKGTLSAISHNLVTNDCLRKYL